MKDCGESNAECCVLLVGVDRVCMILDGFVACIVGKMAQDVGMVESIVVSSPSSLVGFGGFHPYMCFVFIQKTFCDLLLLFFFVSFVF